MNALRKLFAGFVAGIWSLPYRLIAQDQGTYIDNLGVQDSAYMEQDLMTEGAKGGGAGTMVLIIIVVIIIIGIVAYLIRKRKK